MPLDLRVGPVHLHVGREARQADRSPALAEVDHDQVATKASLPPMAVPNVEGTAQIRAAAAAQPKTPSGFPIPPATGAPPDPGQTPNASDASRLLGPIRYQFPYGTNATFTPRGTLRPFDQLRRIADACAEVRFCIETRKDQICSLSWDITPKDSKATGQGLDGEIKAARAFFSAPDPGQPLSTWFRQAIEEILVTDALAIYRRRSRGGDLLGLELVDGATFKCQLAQDGRTPKPPLVAYRQIIYGQPVAGGDCTIDDLIYRPRTVRTWTPYGMSPTEAVMLAVTATLNRQAFDVLQYTEGTLPESWATVPESWQPKDIDEFQTFFDSMMSGNLTQRSRVKFMPAGSKIESMRLRDFQAGWYEWWLKLIAAAFAVPPSELGFTNDVNRATSKSQEDVAFRRGVRPLGSFLKEIFDDVLARDLRLPHLEFAWKNTETEDRAKQAAVDEIRVRTGIDSIDEIRVRDGLPMIGMGNAIFTPTGPLFVEDLIADVDDDPTTTETKPAPAAPAVAATATPKPSAPASEPKPHTEGEIQDGLEGQAKAMTTDLRHWRTVALKAAKAGAPCKPFVSAAIPHDVHHEIETALKAATTPAAVHALFADIEKRKPTLLEQTRMRRKVRTMAADIFRAQGAALLAHLEEPAS